MSNKNKGILKPNLKGFTLIEMVIVILLVGIMAAIAIPKFVNLTSAAKEASYDSGLGSLKSAVGIYLGENQGLWPSGNSVIASMEGTVTCDDTGASNFMSIEDIEGTYWLDRANCDTALTELGQITVYTSVF